MILEQYSDKKTDGSSGDMNILEDNIREIAIDDDFISFVRRDDTEGVIRKDDPNIRSIYLLNDDGKTIKTLMRS